MKRRATKRARLVVEEFEPRILYSADAGALTNPDALAPAAEIRVLTPVAAAVAAALPAALPPANDSAAAGPAANPAANPAASPDTPAVTAPEMEAAVRHELLFVDTGINDYQKLVDELVANAGPDRQIGVVLLDPDANGIEQVAQALAAQPQQVDAMHFITHGTDGAVKLGNVWLDERNLDAYAASIASWQQGLAADADLMLYGCDVADNTDGRALVDALHTLTGANVAASIDVTGNAALGGNWNLEYTAGKVAATALLSESSASAWSGVLATLTVSTTNDVADGNTTSIATLLANKGADGQISLREAIIAANNTAGADQIILAAGTYRLTIGGTAEDFAATGDLDIRNDLTITGAGSAATFIDGNATDRVLNVLNNSTATISNLTIRNGAVAQGAGVQVVAGSTLNLSGAVLSGNNATSQGGAIQNAGTLNLTDVRITGNSVTNNPGGGIYNTGTATATRVTIDGNSAKFGGGIYNAGGSLTLTNVTVSGNTATTQTGGGIYNAAALTATNVTITANTAAVGGGGVMAAGGSTTLKNTLIAGNTGGSPADFSGAATSAGNNLIGNTTGSSGWIASDLQNVNPRLDTVLANNGGTTPTYALLAGSLVINAGTSAGATATDQRGTARDNPDIGAYEATISPVNTVPGAQTTNEDASLVFSTANGNALTVSDPLAAGNPVEVTLSVTSGSLTLSGIAGLAFSAGDGSGDATMTFRGTLASINAALNGLAFAPPANYNGGATLTLTTVDTAISALDIDAALAGRYTFDNTAVLGNDTSPAGTNDGTVISATSVVDGTHGNVLNLNAAGGADYVQIPGHFGNPANVTLAAWVNLTTAPAFGSEVISLGDSVALRVDDGGSLKGFIYDGTAWRNITYAATLAGTGWHHVAVTFDDAANLQTLYLDGAAVATLATTGSIAYDQGANSFIGTHGNGGTLHDFTGKIDDARIYSRALSAAEITKLAADLSYRDTDGVAITVVSVNDAPAGANKTVTTLEDTAYTFTASDFGFADPNDSPANALLNVRIATLPATGSLTLSGVAVAAGQFVSAANINAGNLQFTPAANAFGAGNASFTFKVQDDGGTAVGGADTDATPRTMTVNVTSVKDSPTLDASRAPALAPVQEDAGAPAGAVGTLVSTLVDFATPAGQVDNVTDPEAGALLGIAVTAADTANGAWWYSINNGANWNALGAVSTAAARLLAADAATRLYFQPNANYSGTLAAAITFQAWDQTAGVNGGTAFLSSSGAVLDRFTTPSYGNNDETAHWATDWVEIDISGGGAINGRIQVTGGQLSIAANTLGNNIYRSASLAGATTATLTFEYSSLLASTDAISLQMSKDGGANYTTLAGGIFSSALNTGTGSLSFDVTSYAAADTRIRFLVSAVGSRKTLLVDNVQIAYATVSTGGSTAFSTASDTASLTVTGVNDPPAITLPPAQTVNEDATLVFSAATGNAVSVSDIDAGTAPVQVTLGVTQGTLTLVPTIGSEFRVNSTTAADQQAPRIAVAPDGHYVVVWQSNNQDGSKEGIYARIYNADGTPQTGELAVNTLTLDDQTAPSIAMDASGRFVIAWQNHDPVNGGPGWDIYARSFNADGSAASAQMRINNTTTNDQTNPAVGMDAAGDVVIAWQSKGQDNADGKEGIYARRYAVNLASLGNEFQVNTSTLDAQTSPAIATNAATGDFVIVWESKTTDGSGVGVYGQRFTAAGAAAGSEFRVNATTAADQMAPSVAMNSNGDFVVAWQSKGQDNLPETGKFGIYAQRFNASGVPQAGEFLVNTTIVNDQTMPAVTMQDDGTFAIAWSSLAQDNADGREGIYVQGFAADGTRRGSEFRANTTTLNAQTAPSLVMTASGQLVAVWQSSAQDASGYGVFGQRFKKPGVLTFSAGDGTGDATMTFTGTISDIANWLDGMTYAPAPNYNGPDTLTVNIDDLGNSGSGGSLTAGAALAITVNAVDDAPTQTLPGAQVTNEDGAIVFSSANGNGLSIADIDADPNPVQITLSAANGSVKLASLAGLTVTAGADGSASVTVRGRAADVNAALDGLTYTPNANYFGADAITLATNDLSSTGIGGPYTVSGTIGITINSVNDAPVNVLPATQNTVEGTTLILSTANGNAISLSDVDAFSGSEEVTLASTNGTLKLARTTNLTFSLGNGRGGETRMTFRGTLVNINAALDGMSFTPLSGYAGPAYLEFLANDLGNSGAGIALGDRDVLLINVVPDALNSAPVITVPGNQTTLEEAPLVLSSATANQISVNDDAGGNPIQLTLTATGGTLSLATSTGSEFPVNSTVLNDQQAARVAMDAAGNSVVVWQGSGQDGGGIGVYAQRYNSEGIALAPEFRVNSTTANDQSAPAVAVDAAGNFVVVWQSKSQDGSGFGVYAQRYSAAGIAQGGEFRINSATANDQSAPTIAMDAAGNFVVAWQSDGQDGGGFGIYARRYNAAGVAQGGEFRINTTTANDQSAPAIAMDAAGDFVVAWQSSVQDGDGFGIFARRYNAAGSAQGGEFQVNTIVFRDQTNPAVGMDSTGNFVIAWQSRGDYADKKEGIYAQRYNAAGTALGTQFLVNTNTPNEQANPAIAMDGTGNFVVAWQSTSQDNQDQKDGIYAQRFDTGGNAVGGEFLVNTTTLGAQTAPSAAYDHNGRFIAVWTSEGQDGSGLGVYGQRFFDFRRLGFSAGDGMDDATMTFTGTLDQINDALDGLVFTPDHDFDGIGKVTVTVNDLGNSGSGGAKTSSKFVNITVQPVNDAPVIQVPALQTVTEDTPVIFSTANGNLIVISDVDAGNSKLAVTLSASVGTLTLANTTGLTFVSGTGTGDVTVSFTAKLASIAAALDGLRLDLPVNYTGAAGVQVYVSDKGNTGAGGALVAAATAYVNVNPDAANEAPRVVVPGPQYTPQDTPLALSNANAATIIDDAGSSPVTVTVAVTNGVVTLSNSVGRETLVNTYTTSSQDSARLAMMPDGGYVVVWSSNGEDGSGTGVYAQLFEASGFAIGPEFRVNTTAANNQYAPDVAINRFGQFVVAWVSDGQDSSGSGVYVQRYDAGGNALGAETLANTTIAGNQVVPAVAIADSGAFVVTWEGPDGNGDGVFAQLFDVNGEQVGGEFQVNTTTAGDQRVPAAAMDAAGNFIVVWQGADGNSDGIFAQRYDAGGTALGVEFRVNTTVTGAQAAPAVAMNAAGNFVVAWQGPESGGGNGIFAQRYTSAGVVAGSEFLVNTTSAGNQIVPSVAIDDSGEFVIGWQGTDASGQGVLAQVFRADGSALGREVVVNTTTQGNQLAPSVGMAVNGSYAVAWTGENQDGLNTGIAAQRMFKGDEISLSAGTGINDTLVTLTGTLANINAALDGLVFTPTAGFNGVATIQTSANDLGNTGAGGVLTGAGTIEIVVGKPPVLDLDANDSTGATGSGFAGTFRPGLGAVPAADADATLIDPTSGSLLSLTVKITNLLNAGSETLAAITTGTTIVQSYNAATGTLTLSVSNSVANYQKVLRTITYNNTAASPNTADRLITFTANDGVFNSNVATATIHYPGSNQAPVATIDSYTTAEDTVLTVPARGVLANDTDANADPLSAVLVTGPAHGALSLNPDGSFAYTPVADFSGADGFTYQAYDGLAYSAAVSVAITVTPVNDAPAGANKTVTTLEDTAYAFNATDFGFTDAVDTPASALAAVRIATLPGAGTLQDNGVAVTAGQFVSVADINAGRLVFTPAPNANGAAYAAFTFQVEDDGGTAGGGVDLDATPRTLTVNVTAVNDAPVGNDRTVTTLEDTAYTFVVADFGFADPADAPANALAGVKVTTVPGTGSLALSGVAVSAGQFVSAADISAGNLRFTPAAYANGAASASFTFQVRDDGGTLNGGADTDTTPRTLTVNVTPVNDAPAGTNRTVVTLEDAAYTFAAADFGFTDPADAAGSAGANALLSVKITTLPVAGSLTLAGVAVTAGQFVSVANINAGNLKFMPGANANGAGYASFTFQVQDDGGTSSGGTDIDATPRTLTVNVVAVNDAPVNSGPGAQTGTTNTPLIFSVAGGNAISITDVDAGSTPVRVKLAAADGVLTLSGSAGLTFSSGTGTNDATMIFTGSISDINAALNGLRFDPALNYAGSTTLVIETDDLGNTGAGGAKSDSRTVVVNVSYTNTAPVLNGANNLLLTLEDASIDPGTPVSGLIAGQVSDTDAGALTGIAVTAVDNSHGAWQYTRDGGATWAAFGSPTAASARLLAADAGTFVRFQPNANWHGAVASGITFRAWDQTSGAAGGVASTAANGGSTAFSTATASAGINVLSVNDPPAGASNTVTTPENTPYTFAAADFGFTDPADTPPNALAAVKITTLPAAGTLTNNGVNVVAGQFVSVADINGGKLVFTPAANANGPAYASFTFQVQDDGGTANGGVDLDTAPRTLTLNVTAVNNAPVASGGATLPAALEDAVSPAGATVSALFNANFSDVADAGNPAHNQLAGIAVRGQSVSAAQGRWQYSTDGGSTWSSFGVVSDANALSLGVNDRLRFLPAANYNGSPNNLSVRLIDNSTAVTGGNTINVATHGGTTPFSDAVVTTSTAITAVNDAPAGMNTTVTAVEDAYYTFTAVDFGFSDAADAPANAFTAVMITTLPGAGTLQNDGVAVLAGQWVTVADINAGKLVFTPVANANGAGYAVFTFQVRDDGGTANGGADIDATPRTLTVDVTPVNDAPMGADHTVTMPEDSGYAFTAADFGFSDAADAAGAAGADAFSAVTIAALPTAGTLTVDGATVTAGQFIALADINAGKLVYTPGANASGAGYASFGFQVHDDGGIANGGVDLDATPRTLTVDVTPVNDAPAGADNSVTMLEDAAYAFSLADFGFSDSVDGPANALNAVKIGTLPVAGTLQNNGVNVTAGQFVSAADIGGGKLVFAPAANAHGIAYATFTFQVQDDGGTAGGGVDMDATPRTLTVNVTAVNDAPVGTSNTVTTVEDTAYTFTVADFGLTDAADAPGDALLAVTITSLPGAGSLTNNGVAVSAGQSVAVADINAGKLAFTPAVNAVGAAYAQFTFQVRDDGGTANGGVDLDATPRVMTVDVVLPNNAPVLAGAHDLAPINEDELMNGGTLVSALIAGMASDADPADASGIAVIAVDNSNGAWQFSLDGGAAWTAFGTPSAASARLLAADAGTYVRFVPNAGWNGAVASGLTFRAWDQTAGVAGGTANTTTSGGYSAFSALAASSSIAVNSVNDAPAGASNTVTTLEDTAYTFSAADFGFTDAGDSPSNALLAVRITALPATGTLTNDGIAVTAGQFVSAADISAGKLVFTPVADANGAGYAAFAFRVQDDGGVANGGVDLDPAARIMTVNVLAVNDSPAGADRSVTTLEGTAYVFSVADFGFTDTRDALANPFAAVVITTLPAAGTLSDNGVAVTVGQFVSVAEIVAGRLSFTPVAGASGVAYADFTFQVQDGGGTANGGSDLDPTPRTITVNVTAAPVLPPPVVVVLPPPIVPPGPPASSPPAPASVPVATTPPFATPVVSVPAPAPQSTTDAVVPPTAAPVVDRTTSSHASSDAAAPGSQGSAGAAPAGLAALKGVGLLAVQWISEAAGNVAGFLSAPAANSPADFKLAQVVASAVQQPAFERALDKAREDAQEQVQQEERVVSSAIMGSTGLSVGYLVWLLRSGTLITSLLSSMPAWRTLDPFPVLSQIGEEEEDEDDDSLEALVNRDGDSDAPTTPDNPNTQKPAENL